MENQKTEALMLQIVDLQEKLIQTQKDLLRYVKELNATTEFLVELKDHVDPDIYAALWSRFNKDIEEIGNA